MSAATACASPIDAPMAVRAAVRADGVRAMMLYVEDTIDAPGGDPAHTHVHSQGELTGESYAMRRSMPAAWPR